MELENSTQSGEQAEVVAPQQSPEGEGREGVVDLPTVNADFAMVDTDSGEEGTSEAGDGNAARLAGRDSTADEKPSGEKAAAPAPDGAGRDSGKQAQSAQENAIFHSMRLRAKHEAEEAARAALDAEIAGLGIEDPYNAGKTLNSLSDLRAYSERFRRAKIEAEAKRTGRSASELEEDAANRAFLSSLRRSAELNAARSASQDAAARERKTFIDADVLDFVKQYPEMDADGLAALENNAQFRHFCGSRFGREPLARLYGDYLSFVGDAGAAAVAKASSRSARSTGSGTGGGVILSPAQKSALDKWNEENPEMAMTAKEFLGR